MVLTYLLPKDHMPGFNLGFNHGSSNFVDVDFNQTLNASTLAQGNEQNPTDCEVEGTDNLISIELLEFRARPNVLNSEMIGSWPNHAEKKRGKRYICRARPD